MRTPRDAVGMSGFDGPPAGTLPEAEAPEGTEDPFRVVSAADPGPLPQEIGAALERMAAAVQRGWATDAPPGTVGVRFGRRIVVAPAASPHDAVDVADIDIPRRILLTVGGRDPRPEGALLAQVLFLRSEAVVGFALADAADVRGPTLDVLERIMPPLRTAEAARVDGAGTVVLARTPKELGDLLAQIGPPSSSEGAGDEDVEAQDGPEGPGGTA